MTCRALHAFALSALLLITAVAFGGARGQTHVAGQMVLCIGGAAVTVSVDADGNPVEQVHVCPEAALSFLAGLPDAGPPEIWLRSQVAEVLRPGIAQIRTLSRRDIALARGPPRPV